MNPHITEEQRELVGMVREFCEREIDPHAHSWDRGEIFPADVFRKMGEMGLLGIPLPDEYGGGGGSFFDYILSVEELSKHDAGLACAYCVHLSAHARTVLEFGSPEQRAAYLPKLARGEWIGAFALTEPHCGSDAAALRTRADRDGEFFILNGTKQWITNAKSAGLFLLFARTDPQSEGAKGITAFLVEAGTPGLVVDRKTHKLGMRSSETYDLLLKDCRVPRTAVIGEIGEGFKIAMKTLDGGRIGIAAQALGIAQASLDEAKKFAQQREAFGQPIARFQAIQWKIADMAVRINAARQLTYRAAIAKDSRQPHTKEGAMAKVFASRIARECANESLQVHGGYGYTEEFPVERYYRDAKVTEIYEGTSEIQKIVISRALLQPQRVRQPAIR
ncbi:MAG: acyl-CoA dehydrogenase family protein [Candidatus Sericytochromatia bacterium]|uniref:Acyl-CoA dehydrogenase family protein n=1 Tax=Candidatus Tanganyikabacteria bacterium TaxID=2961651 RepID=A0A937X2S1_9BACT|nr:acyl-CoA dehydrogenase family protein [Candidatus Tanganyikabacteria bacterium]